MPLWITVYCSSSVRSIGSAAFLDGLRDRDPSATAGCDYATLAESYDIDDGRVVRAALEALRVESPGETFEDDYALHYSAEPGRRPVLLRRWAGDRVTEEIEEALERLKPKSPAIEAKLRKSVEVIGIELGASQLQDFGIVLAYEAARYLAQKGQGIICDLEGHWTSVVRGGFVDLV